MDGCLSCGTLLILKMNEWKKMWKKLCPINYPRERLQIKYPNMKICFILIDWVDESLINHCTLFFHTDKNKTKENKTKILLPWSFTTWGLQTLTNSMEKMPWNIVSPALWWTFLQFQSDSTEQNSLRFELLSAYSTSPHVTSFILSFHPDVIRGKETQQSCRPLSWEIPAVTLVTLDTRLPPAISPHFM